MHGGYGGARCRNRSASSSACAIRSNSLSWPALCLAQATTPAGAMAGATAGAMDRSDCAASQHLSMPWVAPPCERWMVLTDCCA